MKNILIACISRFEEYKTKNADGSARKPYTYTDSNLSVDALQTNEACVKYLMKKLSDNGGVNEYIRVLTNAVAQEGDFTLPYLEKTMQVFCEKENLVAPHNNDIYLGEDEKIHRYDRVLSEISKLIQGMAQEDDNINIYLDMAGGKRDNYVFIQLLTKLLSFYGYSIHSYYSDLNGSTGTIVNTDGTFRQLMILDAVNEFVLHGVASPLRECFKTTKSPTVRSLLRAMENFSNAVQLCSTNLSDTVKELEESLYQVEAYVEDKDGELYVIKTMIPLIRKKFHLTSGNSSISTLGVIRWCLENGFVQQALTIYNENVAEIFFENNLVKFDDSKASEDYFKMKGDNKHAPKYSTELIYLLDEVFKNINADIKSQTKQMKTSLGKYYSKDCTNKKDTRWTIAAVYFGDMYIPSCFTVNTDTELFRKILIDTRYAKVRRNTINHASNENSYPKALNDLFKLPEYAYSATQESSVTPGNIIKDMLRAVGNLELAIESVK